MSAYRYEWKVSGEGSEVITMEPSHGVILPSESQVHLSFSLNALSVSICLTCLNCYIV